MDFSEFRDILTAEFPGVTRTQLERFEAMAGLYREWNSKINVVSRRDIDCLYEHHVLHSLGIALYLKYQRPEVFRSWGGKPLLCEGTLGSPVGGATEGMTGGAVSEEPAAGHVSVLGLGCGGLPGHSARDAFPFGAVHALRLNREEGDRSTRGGRGSRAGECRDRECQGGNLAGVL